MGHHAHSCIQSEVMAYATFPSPRVRFPLLNPAGVEIFAELKGATAAGLTAADQVMLAACCWFRPLELAISLIAFKATDY
jgi:hypothetical protein